MSMLTLVILKLFIALVMVLGLSIVAEHVSPKVAGILAGFPLGSALTLFFFGYENGVEFAAESAIYSMPGLAAMLVLIYSYYHISKKTGIALSALGSCMAFFIMIYLLHLVPFTPVSAIATLALASLIFIQLFKPIQNVHIKDKVELNHKVIFLRALCTAALVLLITGVAKWVGPAWSGFFAAFPITLFPLMLIVHFTYDTKHVHTIIKNVPIGLFSLLFYLIAVHLAYPEVGIYWGTLIAYAVAIIYLIIFQKVSSSMLKSN